MKTVDRPEIRADWTNPDEGCKLELRATIDNFGYQLISIATDATTGDVWVELYPGDKVIQFPLFELKRLLDAVPELEEWHRRVSSSV